MVSINNLTKQQKKDLEKYGKIVERDFKMINGKKRLVSDKYSFFPLPEPNFGIKDMSVDEIKLTIARLDNGGMTSVWNNMRIGYLKKELAKRSIKNYDWSEDEAVAGQAWQEKSERKAGWHKLFKKVDNLFENKK